MNELHLAENITRFRHEKKLTQEELADFMGMTKASVSKWEKGQNMPDLLLLPRLAAFFGVTVDRLIGYEAQLSKEQIRRCYGELSQDFVSMPFEEVIKKTRDLAHRYYACYPLLLQLGVLYWNHHMLAETEKEGKKLLEEAVAWCDRILENCGDVDTCSDALVLKAGLALQLGKPLEVIDALEPAADPTRLAGQSGGLLLQAYQMSGQKEKARSYAQVRHYLDLVNLVVDAALNLSFNENNLKQCEETIRRIRGVIELYQLESLHPNITAQFYFQSALVYAANEKEKEAVLALLSFERCVNKFLKEKETELHGDEYFDLLDEWISLLPLGSMAPRDISFVWQSMKEWLSHPYFSSLLKENREFQRLVQRMTNENVRRQGLSQRMTNENVRRQGLPQRMTEGGKEND